MHTGPGERWNVIEFFGQPDRDFQLGGIAAVCGCCFPREVEKLDRGAPRRKETVAKPAGAFGGGL